MIHLFDDDKREGWTDKAGQYSLEVEKALRPTIEKAKLEGVSLRDLQFIIDSTVNELILAKLIGWD